MILGFTFVHEVQVATYLGDGAFGPNLASKVAVSCYLQDTSEDVKTSDGSQVVSSAKLNAPLSAAPSVPPVAGQFTPKSEVTLPSGRLAFVLKADAHDSGALSLGLDHVQVWLS